ncbi:MAG: pilin [Candidatus Nealsonbacteria bacterium]|nr:pilin [Candidatus Nealsonbacteria bacterium]
MKKNKLFIILAVLFALSLAVPYVSVQAQLDSPPTNIDVVGVLNKVAQLLMNIAVPIAIIMVIVAGFYFMTAQGEPGKIETAKKMILWTLIGMAVVLLAEAMVAFVKSSI